MKEQILRKRLLKDKNFLYKIYSESNSKSIKELLAQASTFQINTILHYLHCVVTGKIPLPRENYDYVVNHKKIIRLRRGVETKISLRSRITDKSLGLKYLKDLSNVLSVLFKPMFELKK